MVVVDGSGIAFKFEGREIQKFRDLLAHSLTCNFGSNAYLIYVSDAEVEYAPNYSSNMSDSKTPFQKYNISLS